MLPQQTHFLCISAGRGGRQTMFCCLLNSCKGRAAQRKAPARFGERQDRISQTLDSWDTASPCSPWTRSKHALYKRSAPENVLGACPLAPEHAQSAFSVEPSIGTNTCRVPFMQVCPLNQITGHTERDRRIQRRRSPHAIAIHLSRILYVER